ncbi:MAG: HTTM domain-containing protein, partial [Acidimicrobiales bacterium]|nr:HTTM domain-containing protein [Acidimicrobiales bacterium]
MIGRWARLVGTTIDPRPLAATRLLVAFGALVWLRTIWHRFDTGFDPARMHVVWSGATDRLVDLPPAVPRTLWLVGALVLASGVAARAGAASLAVGVALWLAVDRQHYANGSYFLLLVSTLLAFADSGGAWTPWGPVRRRVEWWPAFLLAAQLSIVYAYAAVQKFRISSLQGHTVDWQL